VKWNLKEAEGKVSARWTKTAYKADKGWTSLHNKTKSDTARTLWSRCSEHMRWKRSFLPGEVWQISCGENSKRQPVQ